MTLLVDTSVWSLAFRRDTPQNVPEVVELRRALGGDDIVVTTGLILQELLQGFVPVVPENRSLTALPMSRLFNQIVLTTSTRQTCATRVGKPVCSLAPSTPCSLNFACDTATRSSRRIETSSMPPLTLAFESGNRSFGQSVMRLRCGGRLWAETHNRLPNPRQSRQRGLSLNHAPVAQRIEQKLSNLLVAGSIPAGGTFPLNHPAKHQPAAAPPTRAA
jgi:hypothetical protein